MSMPAFRTDCIGTESIHVLVRPIRSAAFANVDHVFIPKSVASLDDFPPDPSPSMSMRCANAWSAEWSRHAANARGYTLWPSPLVGETPRVDNRSRTVASGATRQTCTTRHWPVVSARHGDPATKHTGAKRIKPPRRGCPLRANGRGTHLRLCTAFALANLYLRRRLLPTR